MARLNALAGATIAIVAGLAFPCVAQKNSGPLLPMTPPYAVRSHAAPAYDSPPSSMPRLYDAPHDAPRPPVTRAGNPDAERLAQSLPLDPQIRELRDRMPADPQGTERRLGLREPHGPATDLRGRAPSPREIVDALTPH